MLYPVIIIHFIMANPVVLLALLAVIRCQVTLAEYEKMEEETPEIIFENIEGSFHK